MCASDSRIRARLRPCRRRLISGDSSPLMVCEELDKMVVFPGLSCDMVLVVASIGSEGLLATEALQSCLPHQIDLRTRQLWADGQSTLQLHQQRQAARASTHITNSLVLPPDSEIVAPVSICSPSGIQPGRCSLVEIDWDQPGEILSPGCPHHPCLSIPGTRRLPVLSPIKKYGWWNKNGCCHLYCGSGHFHHIKIIVNGSNMTPFHWN